MPDAPVTKMTAGPSPDWSNAIVVPSFEITFLMGSSLCLVALGPGHSRLVSASRPHPLACKRIAVRAECAFEVRRRTALSTPNREGFVVYVPCICKGIAVIVEEA